jgi:hypothetical protein
MPVYLQAKSEFPELKKHKSVLIVPCRFCPAASLAVIKDRPYFEFFKKFLKTDSYERYIKAIKANLESMGIRTGVFKSTLLHQFVVCMWTQARRQKLSKLAAGYEALLVLGCETAVQTIYDAVQNTPCKVYQGMRPEGIMTVLPRFELPANIRLDLHDVIPLVHPQVEALPWEIL